MSPILVKEHPIIFSSEMVKAILEGRKSQTRRVIKPMMNPIAFAGFKIVGKDKVLQYTQTPSGIMQHPRGERKCPYGKVGDRLWVRESWAMGGNGAYYKTDQDGTVNHAWKSPLFMPRWASRITLEIADIRVERLQEISEKDAYLEGVNIWYRGDAEPNTNKEAFEYLWNSLAKKDFKWKDNPWVWVISFWKD